MLSLVSEETLEGTFVFVCMTPEEASCLPCGVAQKTSPGEWTTVHCTEGMIEGKHIKVKHSYEKLELCEIQLFGKTIGKFYLIFARQIK